jgi:hypothetical protein
VTKSIKPMKYYDLHDVHYSLLKKYLLLCMNQYSLFRHIIKTYFIYYYFIELTMMIFKFYNQNKINFRFIKTDYIVTKQLETRK